MVLPILVPTAAELQALLPSLAPSSRPSAPLKPARRDGLALHRLGAWEPATGPRAQSTTRETLVHRWRQQLRMTQRAARLTNRRPVRDLHQQSQRDSDTLLLDCERLLGVFLRRSWRDLPSPQRAQLQAAARRFQPDRPIFAASEIDRGAAAWCMAAMHWRGCRHPAALFCAPMHPTTALVRWLSEFSVVDQVECPREILGALAREIARIDALSRAVTTAMVVGRGVIAMLPELLAHGSPSGNDEKAQYYYSRRR